MANMYPSKKAGGGGGTETVLWTNPSPTSSLYQDSQKKPFLSDSVDNYDAIKIEYLGATSDQINKMTAQWTVSALTAETYGMPLATISSWDSNGITYVRTVEIFPSNRSRMRFSSAYKTTESGSTGSDNTKVIPLNIIGVKY